METSIRPRPTPFVTIAVATLILSIAMARLPASFVAQLERASPLDQAGAGWAYRLLVLAALAQAIYGGFVVFQIERVRKARSADPKLAAKPREAVIAMLGRTAALMVLLTLVYGLAGFWMTGERGGFWVFVLMAVAQVGWYYRQVNEIARWMSFQPEIATDERPRARWEREPADYSPPIARGLGDEPAPDGSATAAG